MNDFLWLMMILGIIFLAYVLYTKQFKWFLGVVRNMVLGAGGILAANFVLATAGVAVGVNLVTVLVVGLLGVPGFLLLYVAQMLVG